MKLERICPICNKSYEVDNNRLKHNHGLTCSYKCGRQLAAQKLSGPKLLMTFTCPLCGKQLELRPFEMKNRKYCSSECVSQSQHVRVTVNCARCGKPIEIQHYRLQQAQNFYCSQECQFPPTIIKCDWCGKEKRIPPSAVKEHNFCNRKCMGQWTAQLIASRPKQRITIHCNWCGKQLEREPNQVNGRDIFYCDHQCFAKWKAENWTGKNNPVWRGGFDPYYGPNWKRQARRARARDEHKCQYCGTFEKELSKKLHVHHITALKTFDRNFRRANALKNLVSLCPACHKFLEWHEDQMSRFLASWYAKTQPSP